MTTPTPSHKARVADATVLFADVSRSTQLFEEHGDAEARRLVARALDHAAALAEEHGGRLVKTIGDEVLCVFPELAGALAAAQDLHPRLKDDEELARVGLAMRIGFHAGEVLEEEGDVFGDAVNVAARMAALAQADQIITNRPTLELLPRGQYPDARTLGPMPVRGKKEPVEVIEVLWQQDEGDRTVMPTRMVGSSHEAPQRLVLRLGERRVEAQAGGTPVTLGRATNNHLVVEDPRVSRHHATIAFHMGKFVLTDRSTNGTFVQETDEDEALFLHRDGGPLRGEGRIALGRDLAEGDGPHVIRFVCEG